jgi:GH24 family phage-related lysozyme (muramidase)
LRDDLERFEKCIISMIDVPLTQNQFDSLVSWAFNVGTGAVQESTLRLRLNRGEDVNTVISSELPRWCKGAGSEPVPGLVRRREAEVSLATTGNWR